MERRTYLVAIGTAGTVGLSGCAEDRNSDSTNSQSESSSSGGASAEETCEIVEKTRQKTLINREYELISEGDRIEETFEVQEFDRIRFDIQSATRSGAKEQEIYLAIVSPVGEAEFSQRVTNFSNEFGFSTTGDARLILTNDGTNINEQRDRLRSGSETLSAGQFYYSWVNLSKGDSVEYFIRQLGDGARPKLVVENKNRNVVMEESVAEVIDGKFTAHRDGEYYFKWENTATLTSGTWRWEFEKVSKEVLPASGTVTVEREFTEEVEICD